MKWDEMKRLAIGALRRIPKLVRPVGSESLLFELDGTQDGYS
ncbi:hypothetical protein J2785_005091 [Burkholderia ambifaria]|nr:hypothetical protein [Burkholderia ambifaria]